MPTIDQLAERVAPVSPTASVAEVFGWFSANPDALALPVVDEGHPVGLIDRQDFLLKLAEPLGHSRYSSRPVARIMDPEPAVVEHDVRISSFSDIILKSSAGTMMRGFIVTRKGLYFGVGTAIALLRSVNDSQSERIAAQETELAALRSTTNDSVNVATAKSDFVNMLKNEFDAPLRSIKTFSEVLARQSLPAIAQSQIHAILDAAEDGLQLLDHARDLAQIQAGVFVLHKEPVVLREFMDNVAADWTVRGRKDDVAIMVSYEGDTELTAMLDRARFRRTFDALIECSLRLVRAGIMEVGLKARVVNNNVEISGRVRDDGPGLDAEQLASQMADLSLSGNLALSTARRLLQDLGGDLWCENNAGRGATYAFDVVVPQYISQDAQDANIAHLDNLDMRSNPHVLIADDNTTNRVVAQALCEMFGCTCETVADGIEAVEAARNGHFDLILMDIKMPRMDGVQATRAIRAFGTESANVPIIALTANADPDDTAGYINAGMLCVVEKPIKPERLRMAMNLALVATDAPHDATTAIPLRQAS